MDLLFKGKSETARGTLSHLKAFFCHEGLKKEVKDNIQHTWDMIEEPKYFLSGNMINILC